MNEILQCTSLILVMISSTLHYKVAAAPDPPFEYYLLRAETVFIGQIHERTDREITFQVIDILRDRTDHKRSSLEHYIIDPEGHVAKESSLWLVLSQGDDRLGKPRQVMSLGSQLDGQCCYRGWIAFPIEDGEDRYVGYLHTSSDRKRNEPFRRLTLDKAKALIQRFPYRGDATSDGFLRVDGKIKDQDGRMIEDAVVMLEANGRKYDERISELDGSYSLEASTAAKKFQIWLTVAKEGYRSHRKVFMTYSHYNHNVTLEKSSSDPNKTIPK